MIELSSNTDELNKRNPERELLNVEQAAFFIGVTSHTLDVWRCTKRHSIPYLKVGRLVKYRKSDLESWLTSRTIGAAA
jgi:excisionase family DNA binding protein